MKIHIPSQERHCNLLKNKSIVTYLIRQKLVRQKLGIFGYLTETLLLKCLSNALLRNLVNNQSKFTKVNYHGADAFALVYLSKKEKGRVNTTASLLFGA